MLLKVFVKADCPNCPAAKELASKFKFSKIFDMDKSDGLAEAAFHSVLCTPSMVLVDDDDSVIQSWRCHVPRFNDISNYAA